MLVLGLLLAIATLAIYNPVAHHSFINFDDDRYVTSNPHIVVGLHWSTVQWAFSTFYEANWHPLTWLSHAADVSLFGLNPAGHHYLNLLFHSFNALLLFWVLWQATGSVACSLMVGALFALHPMNVESVAWVAERKNLLSMTFFLLTLAAYQKYARKPRILSYLSVALLFALGLMAKPMVITLPFVLLLWDCWPLRRMSFSGAATSNQQLSPAILFLEKLPLLLLSVTSAFITLKAQTAGNAVRSTIQMPLSLRFENAAVSYARYLQKLLLPSALAPFYPFPKFVNGLEVLAAIAVLLAITALVLLFRRERYLLVGWLMFLGTLVPMIGIVQVGAAAMADRYAYLPFVGIFIMISFGAAAFARRYHFHQAALPVLALIWLTGLSVVTYRQVTYWQDSLTLWSRTVGVTKENFVAEDNLGLAYVLENDIDGAIPHFRAAVQIKPDDPVGNLNVAVFEQQHGHLDDAIASYKVVLNNTPDPAMKASALADLGSAYRAQQNYALARQSYEEVLQFTPGSPAALVGLGLISQDTGNFNDAVNDYSSAMNAQPTDVGYLLLAGALRANGQLTQATLAEQQASQLSSDLDRARQIADQLRSAGASSRN